MQNFKGLKIINVMASSIDGKIAAHPLETTTDRIKNKFLCREDFLRMCKAVSKCDAVFIGLKTLEIEKGAFRVSHLRKNKSEPNWFVFSRSRNVNYDHPFWKQKGISKNIFHPTSFKIDEKPHLSIEEKNTGKQNIKFYIGNLSGLLNHLKDNKIKKIALLGGGKLNAAFWEQNIVDELLLTICPIILGSEFSPTLISSSHLISQKLKCKKIVRVKDFIFVDYIVKS